MGHVPFPKTMSFRWCQILQNSSINFTFMSLLTLLRRAKIQSGLVYIKAGSSGRLHDRRRACLSEEAKVQRTIAWCPSSGSIPQIEQVAYGIRCCLILFDWTPRPLRANFHMKIFTFCDTGFFHIASKNFLSAEVLLPQEFLNLSSIASLYALLTENMPFFSNAKQECHHPHYLEF